MFGHNLNIDINTPTTSPQVDDEKSISPNPSIGLEGYILEKTKDEQRVLSLVNQLTNQPAAVIIEAIQLIPKTCSVVQISMRELFHLSNEELKQVLAAFPEHVYLRLDASIIAAPAAVALQTPTPVMRNAQVENIFSRYLDELGLDFSKDELVDFLFEIGHRIIIKDQDIIDGLNKKYDEARKNEIPLAIKTSDSPFSVFNRTTNIEHNVLTMIMSFASGADADVTPPKMPKKD